MSHVHICGLPVVDDAGRAARCAFALGHGGSCRPPPSNVHDLPLPSHVRDALRAENLRQIEEVIAGTETGVDEGEHRAFLREQDAAASAERLRLTATVLLASLVARPFASFTLDDDNHVIEPDADRLVARAFELAEALERENARRNLLPKPLADVRYPGSKGVGPDQ